MQQGTMYDHTKRIAEPVTQPCTAIHCTFFSSEKNQESMGIHGALVHACTAQSWTQLPEAIFKPLCGRLQALPNRGVLLATLGRLQGNTLTAMSCLFLAGVCFSVELH